MIFNILIGNTDDHAKNHALFWDGKFVRLTPAFDICIIPRIGFTAGQAMEVGEQGKLATIANALSSSRQFGLSREEAGAMIAEMESLIRANWRDACDQSEMPARVADNLWHRAVLSPAIFEN